MVFAYSDFVFLYEVTCFHMSKHYERRFFNNQRHYGWKEIVNLYIVISCMAILYGSRDININHYKFENKEI